jgi:hypothetical protein
VLACFERDTQPDKLQPSRVQQYKVLHSKVGPGFGFALFSVFLLSGAAPLLAQTQNAPGSSTNQATLNARPSLSTPKQDFPALARQHNTHVAKNQAGAKPSPIHVSRTARANLSSVGPGGYSNVLQPFLGNADWAGNPFLPSPPQVNVRPPWAPTRHHRDDYVLAVPVYIPYAADSNESAQANSGNPTDDEQFSDGEGMNEEMNDEGMSEDASEPMAPEVERDPVVTQPATVLVFKDGHRSDVINYAIVGDTLFDFGDGVTRKIQLTTLDLAATQKANEAIGVEFKLPPASNR